MVVSGGPVVIGIAGRMGAGKTAVGSYLATSHGFQYVRYSQVLADWQARDSDSKHDLQQAGWNVMAGGQQPELNRRLIAQIDPMRSCAVDGLRHPIDSESLCSAFPSLFRLLFVDCPFDARWGHVKHAGRYSAIEEFRLADEHAVERQIDDLKPRAFLILVNDGPLQALYSKIDEALLQIPVGAFR
jgi:dephospho-CoA kinase